MSLDCVVLDGTKKRVSCGRCGESSDQNQDILRSGWAKTGWTNLTGEKFVRYTCPDCTWKESER